MKYFRFFLILYFLIFNFSSYSVQWFCKEGSSKRFDNTFEVCGIGNDSNEDNARKNALNNAFNEFDLVCNKSDDCKGKFKQVSPLRIDCEKSNNKYICYRAFYIVVDPSKEQNKTENISLANELNDKENQIKENQKKYGVILSEKFKLQKELERIRIQNQELSNKIREKENYINENKKLKQRLAESERVSIEIKGGIDATIKKEFSFFSLITPGMSVKNIDKILGTKNYDSIMKDFKNKKIFHYNELDYGTIFYYKIKFSDTIYSIKDIDKLIVSEMCIGKTIGKKPYDCSHKLIVWDDLMSILQK
jgi:hypothetical protein